MDPNEQRMIKSASNAADETSQTGYLLAGGVALIIGGIILIMQSHAEVADFGGGMLALIGLALGAASVWLSSQER